MSLIVIVLYITVGSLLIFTNYLGALLQGQLRTIAGILCIVYGVFRLVRWYSGGSSTHPNE